MKLRICLHAVKAGWLSTRTMSRLSFYSSWVKISGDIGVIMGYSGMGSSCEFVCGAITDDCDLLDSE